LENWLKPLFRVLKRKDMPTEFEKVERILARIDKASVLDVESLADAERVNRQLGVLTADDMYKQFSI
jgi:hypothetical protein